MNIKKTAKTTKKKKVEQQRKEYVSPSQKMLLGVQKEPCRETDREKLERSREAIIQFSTEQIAELSQTFRNYLTLSKDVMNVFNIIADNLKEFSREIGGQSKVLLNFQKEIQSFSDHGKKLKGELARCVEVEKSYRQALNDIATRCVLMNGIAEHTDKSILSLCSSKETCYDAMEQNFSSLYDVIQISQNCDFEGKELNDGFVLVKIKESLLNSLAVNNPLLRCLEVYGGKENTKELK